MDLVNEWYSMFKLYLDVFPGSYFRYLRVNLIEHFNNGTYIYEDGVLLTYKQMKRTIELSECIVNPGDYILDKLVSINPGNGSAQHIMDKFLYLINNNTCYIKVKADNIRALRFYNRNGFIIVSHIKLGIYDGYVLKLSKKNHL